MGSEVTNMRLPRGGRGAGAVLTGLAVLGVTVGGAALASRPAHPEVAQTVQAQGATEMTMAQAVSLSRTHAVDDQGAPLTAAARDALPTVASVMTMKDVEARMGASHDETRGSDLKVWVVTVHGHQRTSGYPGHPGDMQNVFTVVYDAASGEPVMEVIGRGADT